MEEIFLILVGIAWALGTPLIAIMALVRTPRLGPFGAPTPDRRDRRPVASAAH